MSPYRTDEPGRRKALVTGAVATNLAVLGVFKYYGFFAESVADMLGTVGVESPIPFLRFILPVGISFLTFHAISYVVDIYRRRAGAGAGARLLRVHGVLPPPRRRTDRSGASCSHSSAARGTRARSRRAWPSG